MWTISTEEPVKINGQKHVKCKCSCGTEAFIRPHKIRGGKTKKCVLCRNREMGVRAGRANTRHGMYKSAEYSVWRAMLNRCAHPTKRSKCYEGVAVCDRWKKFENFYEDMGPRPSPHHSIDRLESARGYEPGNCRWATLKEQTSNKAWNKKVVAFGQEATVPEFAEKVGLSRERVWRRLRAGWSLEAALQTPVLSRQETGKLRGLPATERGKFSRSSEMQT